jgi:tRNA modification GTPase
VVDEIVGAALAAGARLAEPGEFTRRAFLNGKLDLTQAEAVADLIAAHSRAARRAALEQLRGRLRERLQSVRGDLVTLLADVEASIDFVEDGVEFCDRGQAAARGRAARRQLDDLLASAADGVLLRSGVRVSLAGAPNVGKSSLFNRLVEEPRALVTEHPGTTRDVLRETIRVGGLAIVVEDTAGMRPASADPIEALGMARGHRSHAEADIVLHVLEATRPPSADEEAAIARLAAEAAVIVLNKVDLLASADRRAATETPRGAAALLAALRGGRPAPAEVRCVAVSAATGAGLEDLRAALAENARTRRLSLQSAAQVAINQRHHEALLRARAALDRFVAATAAEPPEILAADLRAALGALDEVSGAKVGEDVLDAIFARFCIGK